MRRAVLDTNLYVDWLNRGRHEELLVGRGLLRFLSAVVYMELAAGAGTAAARKALTQLAAGYAAGNRIAALSPDGFARAGRVLCALRAAGRDVARASFLDDVLIAVTARSLGATVYTADADFEAIRRVEDFDLVIVR